MSGEDTRMAICEICGQDYPTSNDHCLILEDVPENTFNFSENTIRLQMASCKFCGCVKLINVPLSDDFDVVYRSIGVSVDYREEKKRQIEQFVKLYDLKDKNILEVGCGNGQFLEILREIGVWNMAGIESGADHCRECADKGFRVIRGGVLNDLMEEPPFDAFMTFHYLEHLPNPVEFSTSLCQCLKPGGVGLIEVPNYDYIEKNHIWLEFTKDHRFYYRKRTLCYLLAKSGFIIERMEENNSGICLTVTVRKPDTHDPDFSSMKQSITEDIQNFKRLIDGLHGAFAVYGAGHYAQLLINMIYRRYGIRPLHVYDSNRQKCGHKICGIVIEHKDDAARMKDCDNIIVICGLYNDEVCRMLSGLGKNIIQWG